ncbi:MAG: type II secretion system protein [Planctomycetes bacterium]|nr:type II secretion system protein [Planctomycetota bacterium]
MQKSQSGFTLIELLVVISIIGVLAAVLLPRVLETRSAANAFADGQNLNTHFLWMERYQQQHDKRLPSVGGHRFVMSTWTSKVFDHTPENLDKYFTPGAENDPAWTNAKAEMRAGQDPWPTINDVSSESTHYCGRAQGKLRTALNSANEAWIADDNEGVWNNNDGTVNILMNGGQVRTYSYQQMVDQFGLGDLDLNVPVQTWGPNSPIPECQNLDN